MGWDVTVTMPGGDHPLSGMGVDEKIAGFASSPGSMVCATEMVGFPKLPHCESPEQCMEALAALIAELEKGNDGNFSDDWAVQADQSWSGGRESRESWGDMEWHKDKLPESMNTYEKWTGHWKRNQLRDDAQRFYLYYLAGCKVELEW